MFQNQKKMFRAPIIFEMLPLGARSKAFEMLEFLAYRSGLQVRKESRFVEIFAQLSQHYADEMEAYLRFLLEKDKAKFAQNTRVEILEYVVNKIMQHLKKVPASNLQTLQNTLKKIYPQKDTEVLLKIGSSANPENFSFYILLSHTQEVENIALIDFFEQLFERTLTHQLDLLKHILDDFSAENDAEYFLTFMPITHLDDGLVAFQFSLKIAEKM